MSDNEKTDDVRYELRIDRATFSVLCQLADQHGTGVGGQIRHLIKNGIDRSRRQAKCADQVSI